MNKEEKIEYGRYVIGEVTTHFLKQDTPYIILSGYEYIREVITLYAKQTNLLESTLILLENNHAEEAYLLLRSMLNNTMLIQYLFNDDKDSTRYKEYMVQPEKAQLSFLYDVKHAINKGWIDKEKLNNLGNLGEKIQQYEQYLINKKYTKSIKKRGKTITVANRSLLNIKSMALTDEFNFGTYIGFYREGSKYEHSDYSTLSIYRQQVLEDVPNTQAFILDLTRTDIELEEKVLNTAISIYTINYTLILKHMVTNHKHLFTKEELPILAGLTDYFTAHNKYFIMDEKVKK